LVVAAPVGFVKAATATYGVVQPIARQLGMTTLGTLHDRIGDTSLECDFGTISRVHVQKQARGVLRALAGGINDEVDTSCLLWRDVPAHACQVC
jgi:hypothetical protein